MRDGFLSDVDGCTANMIGGYRLWMNETFGFDFDPKEIVFHDRMGRSPGLADLNEELARWFPGDATGDNRGFGGAFTCFMRDPNVYTRWIEPIPGAVDAIAEIRQKYDVVFVTALMKGARDHFRSKMEWIERWFPELPIMTGPSGQKFRVAGKFAVDDRYDTCRRWVDNGYVEDALLFGQPWSEVPANSGWIGHDWEQICERVMDDE